MRVIKTLALRGPNCWLRQTCLEVWVECLWSNPRDTSPTPARLATTLATLLDLPEPTHTLTEPTSRFPTPWRDPSPWATLLARLARDLLRDAGSPVLAAFARPTSDPHLDRAIFEYRDEPVARAALDIAHRWITTLVQNLPLDSTTDRATLRATHQNITLGPSTGAIVDALERRNIPCRRLNEASLVQAGFGSRQRRILAAETDHTSAIAQEIAQDKELTRFLLRGIGVPVPDGQLVDNPDHAWQIAQEIGPPVVVKPSDGNQGRGVSTNLFTRDQVVAAYATALEVSRSGQIIVERFAPGGDYRILVIGGRVVAAARREPPCVFGDGRHTIAQLIEITNQDPRRGQDHATPLSKIPLDDISLAVLQAQGFRPDDILPRGRPVQIRRNANLSTGGTAADVTNRLHPQVIARCLDAAQMVGLDIAGIDVVARDIARPLEEQGGVIVEVNAAPGLRMHLEPSEGSAQPVAEAIAELLFPQGAHGRIPIAAVTGVNGKTTVTRLIAHLMAQSGRHVGMTCTDGVHLDGRRLVSGDCSGPVSARMVLGNPAVDVAVLETARGGILRAGLGFDSCDVAVVTNIGSGDHLGIGDVHNLDDLAYAKGTIVANVAPTGTAVLNAADPRVLALASRCPGSILLFATDPANETLTAHIHRGGRAAVIHQGSLHFRESDHDIPVLPLSEIPITHNGSIPFQVENVLAAASAAWAMGLDLDDLRRGLASARSAPDSIPGRFNVLDFNGATVVVDYGHNLSALEALIRSLDALPNHRRRHVVYSAAGDRRDQDILDQAALLGRNFDHVYLYEDMYMRGKKEGEIIALFSRGLAGAPRTRSVADFQGAHKATEAALAALHPGDLLLVQADTIDETVALVTRHHQRLHSQHPAAATPIPTLPLAAARPFD